MAIVNLLIVSGHYINLYHSCNYCDFFQMCCNKKDKKHHAHPSYLIISRDKVTVD